MKSNRIEMKIGHLDECYDLSIRIVRRKQKCAWIFANEIYVV